MTICTGSAASARGTSTLVTSALRLTTPTSSRIMLPPRSLWPTTIPVPGLKRGRAILYNLHDETTDHDLASSRPGRRVDAADRRACAGRAAQGRGVRLRTARYQP